MPLHIRAENGQVSKLVMAVGDPDRATYLAEKFLTNPVRYNEYRHLYGYTGTYKGVQVSIQTHGMGTGSASLVFEELIMLGAQTIIRLGTAGIISPSVKPCDLVVAMGSVPCEGTTQQYIRDVMGGNPIIPLASFPVVRKMVEAAEKNGFADRVHCGQVRSEDGFYCTSQEHVREMAKFSIMAIEMECSCLFTVGIARQIQTGGILVASNYVDNERPSHFKAEDMAAAVDMGAQIVLDTLVSFA